MTQKAAKSAAAKAVADFFIFIMIFFAKSTGNRQNFVL
jgi:hypothetical protein